MWPPTERQQAFTVYLDTRQSRVSSRLATVPVTGRPESKGVMIAVTVSAEGCESWRHTGSSRHRSPSSRSRRRQRGRPNLRRCSQTSGSRSPITDLPCRTSSDGRGLRALHMPGALCPPDTVTRKRRRPGRLLGPNVHFGAVGLDGARTTLTAVYEFPAEHSRHVRNTNPIESTFATVRHRTSRTHNVCRARPSSPWPSSRSRRPSSHGERSAAWTRPRHF
ncbi:hypothetical protein QFZ98_000067 [Paraburkholderia youngii]